MSKEIFDCGSGLFATSGDDGICLFRTGSGQVHGQVIDEVYLSTAQADGLAQFIKPGVNTPAVEPEVEEEASTEPEENESDTEEAQDPGDDAIDKLNTKKLTSLHNNLEEEDQVENWDDMDLDDKRKYIKSL